MLRLSREELTCVAADDEDFSKIKCIKAAKLTGVEALFRETNAACEETKAQYQDYAERSRISIILMTEVSALQHKGRLTKFTQHRTNHCKHVSVTTF